MSFNNITEVSPAGAFCPAGEVAEEGCVSTSAASRAQMNNRWRYLNQESSWLLRLRLRDLPDEHRDVGIIRTILSSREDEHERPSVRWEDA